jgi:hypothetical protein
VWGPVMYEMTGPHVSLEKPSGPRTGRPANVRPERPADPKAPRLPRPRPDRCTQDPRALPSPVRPIGRPALPVRGPTRSADPIPVPLRSEDRSASLIVITRVRAPTGSFGFPSDPAFEVAPEIRFSALRWEISTGPARAAQGLRGSPSMIFSTVHRRRVVIPRSGRLCTAPPTGRAATCGEVRVRRPAACPGRSPASHRVRRRHRHRRRGGRIGPPRAGPHAAHGAVPGRRR